jgi:hypothetical protein
MMTFILPIGLIFLLMAGWIGIQQLARAYAKKHPELGAVKEEGLGCGKNCGCKTKTCEKENLF